MRNICGSDVGATYGAGVDEESWWREGLKNSFSRRFVSSWLNAWGWTEMLQVLHLVDSFDRERKFHRPNTLAGLVRAPDVPRKTPGNFQPRGDATLLGFPEVPSEPARLNPYGRSR